MCSRLFQVCTRPLINIYGLLCKETVISAGWILSLTLFKNILKIFTKLKNEAEENLERKVKKSSSPFVNVLNSLFWSKHMATHGVQQK